MSLSTALPLPDIYYDPFTSGKCYYVLNSRENYIPVTEANLKRMMKGEGYSHECEDDEPTSELDRLLDRVQIERDVDYAGPLAGYDTGVYMIQNRRVLVTEGPRLIEPKEGSWDTLEQLFRNLLVPEVADNDGDVAWGSETQLWVFYSWLKISLQSLRAKKRRPGQVLVIAGAPGCGKSLVQNLLTKMLGGRSAKPYQYLSGGTQFNSDLFPAEHLMIEDETASFDHRVRRQLGQNLKGMVVNETQRCHPKMRPAMTLPPFWRVSFTLNDEAEDLMVLPPLNDGLGDKLILFRAYAKTPAMPMPTETLEQWGAFMAVIEAELPGFIHYLLNTWQIPTDMRCQRYGVGHFHHPDLLNMISAVSPEAKLLELIDAKLFPPAETSINDPEPWEGKASSLEVKLCDTSSSVGYEARKLLTFNSACGQFLGRLAVRHPDRISSRLSGGYTLWKIQPPPAVD